MSDLEYSAYTESPAIQTNGIGRYVDLFTVDGGYNDDLARCHEDGSLDPGRCAGYFYHWAASDLIVRELGRRAWRRTVTQCSTSN